MAEDHVSHEGKEKFVRQRQPHDSEDEQGKDAAVGIVRDEFDDVMLQENQWSEAATVPPQ
jgi:hypothetical protein